MLAGLLYLAYLAGLHDAGRSDATGNALTEAFLALFGAAPWLAFAGLLLVAFKNGKMPAWAAIGALVLVPLACYASFVSADQSPNLKWLVGARCDLKTVLTDLAARLGVVRDSSRIDKLADTMEALGR